MLEMPRVAISQELISQHRTKCRRHRHGELEGHLIPKEPLHHREERDITFRYRLEEPVLLKKLAVLRMPDEREMRVKKEREVAGGHCRFQSDDCRLWKAPPPNLKSEI